MYKFTLPKDSKPSVDNIIGAIKYNESYRAHYDSLYNYYHGKHDILKRFKPDTLKNNKIVVNHPKYITDTNTGYLLGTPVEYKVVNEGDDISLDPIIEEYKKQTISNLDHELAKNASIFGKTYEYTYATEDNSVHSRMIDPRNCIIVYDESIEHDVLFGIIYSDYQDEGKYRDVIIVDNSEIAMYELHNDKTLKKLDVSSHGFKAMPLIPYCNNMDEEGDFECVLELIDAYNTLQSDRINDKEQLVEAIMVLKDVTITPALLASAKLNRVIEIPKDSSIEYITKILNEADTDVLRQVIEADIHKISMTPNLADENFVGNSSGVAIKYKLLAFEQNTSNKERCFEVSLLKRFSLYSNYLSTIAGNNISPIEAYQVDAVFKRNLPQNDLETSQMISNLTSEVDRETLISQLSFVKDSSKVIKKVDQEQLDKANTQDQQFGTMNPSTDQPVNQMMNATQQDKVKS